MFPFCTRPNREASIGLWRNRLFQFHHGDSCAAELHVLVSGRLHTWVCVEIIADELAQDACSGAVQDAHLAGSHQYGIVDEVGDSLQSFLAAHASHVNVLLEVQVFVAYLVLCIAAYKGDDSLPLVLFGLLGTY